MKNIFDPAGNIARKVEKGEREGRPTYTMISESTYDTDADDLWDAITNKERLPRWFGQVEGDLRLGGHYQVKDNASGTIIQCEKLKGFELTWEYAGDVSWVKVELTIVQPNKTQLHLQHQAGAEGDHFNIYGPGAVGVGWDLWITFLSHHIKTNGPIDENELLATSAGKNFTSVSAKSWGKATADAGYDRKWSFATSEKTAKFYSGEES